LLDGGRYPRPPGRETNLARARRLLARLGHPERSLTTVLVAGTKGKGSTAAMLAAVETAAGRRVGLYTKPHLVDYRERIQVDGGLIAPQDLAGLVDEVRPAVEAGASDPEGVPTYFEASVALALLYFHRCRVDLAVLEVGMGGRLDATNACNPRLSVITPISYDHMEALGRTLWAIAGEKAGIVRPGRPVVAAPQPQEAEVSLREACAQAGASLVRVADRARWETRAMSASGQVLWLRGACDYGMIRLPLVGRHQALNAATAVVAAEELGSCGFPLPPEAVRRGLEGLRWPARVEVVRTRPLGVVDVAHNVAAMQALRDALLEVWPGRRLVLVFGMVASHDHEGPSAVIVPLADLVITTTPDHFRPVDPQALAEVVRVYAPQVEVERNCAAAVRRALAAAGPEDLVCVTGSFYLAGEARALLAASGEEVALAGERPAEGTR
ncbi:MAG: Mur ligase family protein, partial [Armatimonadota bacterium]|nr:Mur ligase family protein [Armatimonadota bacterium]